MNSSGSITGSYHPPWISLLAARRDPGNPFHVSRIYGGVVDTQQGRQYDVTRDGRFLVNTILSDAAAPNYTPNGFLIFLKMNFRDFTRNAKYCI
jgi:hypothetical protein